jgi:ATP-dependent Clp protease adaptor protein ClpS
MATNAVLEEKIKEKIKVKQPKNWKVIILNDNETPVDFVIALLIEVFHHTVEKATDITITVHEEGSGVAGEYTFEIAESKAVEATTVAREASFPLQIKIEQV